MSRPTAILVLAAAAVLEAAGDAIMRKALHHPSSIARILLFSLSAAVLFAYGWVVNAPPWDFGKLLGIYVVFFFITAQTVSWLFFRQPLSRSGLIAGLLIIGGGVVFAIGND